MHELSLVQGLLELVVKSAREHQITRVKRIKLVIGKGFGALPEALSFAFAVLSKDTLCHGAALEVEFGQGQELWVDYYEGD